MSEIGKGQFDLPLVATFIVDVDGTSVSAVLNADDNLVLKIIFNIVTAATECLAKRSYSAEKIHE